MQVETFKLIIITQFFFKPFQKQTLRINTKISKTIKIKLNYYTIYLQQIKEIKLLNAKLLKTY